MSDKNGWAVSTPPGYGETIGGVVLLDPPTAVIEAACDAFFSDPHAPWSFVAEMDPKLAEEVRARMRAVVRAIVTASGEPHAQQP